MLKQLVKKGLVNGLWYTLGRKDLVRLARFLANESRLDGANEMERNGELRVQRTVLNRLLKNGQGVAFDIGANVGLWTKALLAQSHGAHLQVHAFEPCHETLQTLSANLMEWKIVDQVTTSPLALSSTAGETKFYSHGSNVGRNSLYPTGDTAHQSVQTVTAETLDGYCQASQIDHIDLVKIDTEGHDLEVMHGARRMLEQNHIEVVQFEYNWRWIDSRHYLKDVFGFLLPLGYSIGKVTPLGIEFYSKWDFELETFREANYLAVKSRLVSKFPRIKWWNEAS